MASARFMVRLGNAGAVDMIKAKFTDDILIAVSVEHMV